jgi:hypothetical protein
MRQRRQSSEATFLLMFGGGLLFALLSMAALCELLWVGQQIVKYILGAHQQ